jgi:ribosomal protein L21E
MPHPRFKNLVGTILTKEGSNAYTLQIKDGNKLKNVVSRAIHLVKLK